jgi:hypothetical protein
MTEETRESSFDDLAKGMASGTLSRRKALRMLGAALVGGTLASIPGVALAANPCPSPRIKCRGQCCAEGVTTCQGTGKNKTCGPVPCQTGLTLCSGQCVDTATDATNCGSCGIACNQGQSCVNGACVTNCTAGQTRCGTTCVDLQTSVTNCGSCGNACAPGDICVNGACGCPATPTGGSCGRSLDCCSGKCRRVVDESQQCPGDGTGAPCVCIA